jgi:hypothetical protein
MTKRDLRVIPLDRRPVADNETAQIVDDRNGRPGDIGGRTTIGQ